MPRPTNIVRDWKPGAKVIVAFALAALAGIIFFLLIPTQYGFGASRSCGVERWPVKVVADQDITSYPQPMETTIATLSAIPAPANPDANQATRFTPTETTVFSLDATITLIKHEADGDYHMVVSDGAGHTMIVEAPDPACAGASYAKGYITAVRSAIDAYFGGPIAGKKPKLSIPVTVTGLGFFDKCHGQEGRAPSCIELHPLLSIMFR
jgi:hypothetical protein